MFLCLYAPFLECLLEFPCQWNYRPDHCIYGSNCISAEEEGIYILHGNRGVYHDHKQPAFRAVYEAIRKVGIPWCVCVSVCEMLEGTIIYASSYVRPKHGFDTVGFVHRSDLRKKNCKIQNSLHKIKKKDKNAVNTELQQDLSALML